MASGIFRRCRSLTGLLSASLLAGCAGIFSSEHFLPLVTEQKHIPDVSVIVSHKADGIYQVQVLSKLPGTISLQWNGSVYVNTAGEAVRLIHIPNLDNFPDRAPTAQTPSAISRRVRFNTHFAGESWLDFARRGVTPRPKDKENKARIYLAFEIKGKRVYWKGEVAFLPVEN